MRNRIIGIRSGSLTVEASLVMIITLSVMAFIISSGLFMYDRCVMLGGCYKGAVSAANQSVVKNRVDTGKAAATAASAGKPYFLRSYGFEGSYSWGRATVTASGSRSTGDISLMGLVLPDGKYTTQLSMSCYCPRKERIIRTARAAVKLKNRIGQNFHGGL